MLNSFFSPKSIAIIGASGEKQKLGYTILKNVIDYKFKGKIYPINLKSKAILGLKAFKSVKEIPGKVDLAVFVIPAPFVNSVLIECGEKGIHNAIIITAGFKEVGKQGQKMEEQLIATAKKYKINILGPNCLGLLDSTINLNASFAEGMISPGNVAFMSQSGAICTAMLDWARLKNFGFSRFISLGNKSGINENDLIEFFIKDKKTKVVLAYLEGFADGQKFMKLAKKLSAIKPLIIVKSGQSAEGQAAIASHTGSLAGANEAVNAAFTQTNTLRAEGLADLFNLIKLFSGDYQMVGNKVAIVANAGGPGVLTTDAIANSCLELVKFQKATTAKLKKELPSTANIHNPVDVIGDARADRYEVAIKSVLNDKGVDGLITILTPQTVTEINKTAEVIIEYSKKTKKPIVTSFIGGQKVDSGIKLLEQNNVPHYLYPETAVRSLEKFYLYNKNNQTKQSFVKIQVSENKKNQIKKILNKADGSVDFQECEKILKAYDIPVINSGLATSSVEAGKFAEKFGYPIAMKVISKDIIHKSDAGGVKIKLQDKKQVMTAYNEILKNCKKYKKNAKIDGVLLQPMVKGGKEIIFGLKRDPQFGPLIMFGLGGVYVEVLKDVAFRLAPLSKQQAKKMVQEIKSYKLLTGVRGEKACNIDSIENTILKISQLAIDFSEIQEMDINPAFVGEKGLNVVDVRILV
ncbi:acetate--CoA ligase family protein [Candidatus Falkowbacteria bacterium]|jgi:acetate---CoA ligase (ADP-forming)|nr:acetate--CoA ligase family protein [Candidatus Falkowbacteria bacterium]MBT6573654.1 acetate--CoA ligase family protein [Candidatus Falkowbacteria bacterium]MBT7348273.1 acetate--CoA ligase family protein [Candidatus Falkowbacteria bacterium]MBT7500125.1 acetate--CoA ligase family protein [Candidatus Falkowbacteria bacterium]